MSEEREAADRLIVEYLRHEVADLFAVYRFGSTVAGTPTPSSDVDVAMLTGTPVSPERWFVLQETLGATLGREVDLLDLAGASAVLAVQVITRGYLLWEAAGPGRGAFEDRALGAYARLNEERRTILERVAMERTIHGR
jgi:predicted nucleotidyltransferase